MICQLLIDPPAAGSWNMAVDEALLATAADEGIATLRLYQWNEPTLSLGYFQRYDDREQHSASRHSAVVRRQTGGGAILHDRELTYSLALPSAHPLARQNRRLYTAVHQAFIELLQPSISEKNSRFELQLHCEASLLRPSAEPFLCFARRAKGDLLLVDRSRTNGPSLPDRAWKILGSAQRRHRGAILQHGGLLLEASSAAPDLPGVRDLTGVAIDVEQLTSALPSLIGDVLSASMHNTMLSNEMRQRAARIEQAKYGFSGWTKRR